MLSIQEMDKYEKLVTKNIVMGDEKALELATNLGQRVAEMTRIVKAGILALGKDLAIEYS